MSNNKTPEKLFALLFFLLGEHTRLIHTIAHTPTEKRAITSQKPSFQTKKPFLPPISKHNPADDTNGNSKLAILY